MDAASPVSFRRDVIAAMNVGGCNAGACHGTPSGKNGFKLSLRGFDPAADYLQLTREQFGRRTDKHRPQGRASLLLKGVGQRTARGRPSDSATDQRTRLNDDRVARRRVEGRRPDAARRCKKVEVTPSRSSRAEDAGPVAAAFAVNVTGFADVQDPRRDPPDRLQQQRPVDRRRDAFGGIVEFKQPRRDRRAVPVPSEELVSVQRRRHISNAREGFTWPNPPEVNNLVDTHGYAKLEADEWASFLRADLQRRLRVRPARVPRLHRPDADAGGSRRRTWPTRTRRSREKLIDALGGSALSSAISKRLEWADVLRSSRKTIQVKG